tara:strand:- start:247 stop:681 length:435 start_codon:yes stop_codon:yes gene_type:complete
MRQGNGSRRSRGRGNGKRQGRGGQIDSHGPDIRIRGSAQQVCNKYLALARDATSVGDRISAENLFQHAEHYFRIMALHAESTGQQEIVNNNQEKNGDVKEESPKGNDEKSEKGVDDLPDSLSSNSDSKKSKGKPKSPQEQTVDN